MQFTTDPVNLSLRNASTGKALTASLYNVEFDDGTSRKMSIGELVMAICMTRATKMESDVVDIMDTMASTTANIEALSDIETQLIDKNTTDLRSITGSWTITKDDGSTQVCTNAYDVFTALGISTSGKTVDEIIDVLEAKLDTLNTTSQEQMITLQSQTNKRDQSYEMISNVLKSFYTVMSGIVNNV